MAHKTEKEVATTKPASIEAAPFVPCPHGSVPPTERGHGCGQCQDEMERVARRFQGMISGDPNVPYPSSSMSTRMIARYHLAAVAKAREEGASDSNAGPGGTACWDRVRMLLGLDLFSSSDEIAEAIVALKKADDNALSPENERWRFETLTKDRDEWRRRAEAAERVVAKVPWFRAHEQILGQALADVMVHLGVLQNGAECTFAELMSVAARYLESKRPAADQKTEAQPRASASPLAGTANASTAAPQREPDCGLSQSNVTQRKGVDDGVVSGVPDAHVERALPADADSVVTPADSREALRRAADADCFHDRISTYRGVPQCESCRQTWGLSEFVGWAQSLRTAWREADARADRAQARVRELEGKIERESGRIWASVDVALQKREGRASELEAVLARVTAERDEAERRADTVVMDHGAALDAARRDGWERGAEAMREKIANWYVAHSDTRRGIAHADLPPYRPLPDAAHAPSPPAATVAEERSARGAKEGA